MKILFETLGRDSYEIYDPCIHAAAEAKLVANQATNHDALRILSFDPATLSLSDVTGRYYDAYDGTYDDEAPAWIKEKPDFDSLAEEERRNIREHYRSLRVA